MDLIRRGIDDDLIDKYIDDSLYEYEEQCACDLAIKKFRSDSDVDKVKKYLTSEKTVSEAVNEVVNATYIVSEDMLSEYINRMKTLCDNMMTSEGRSKEYKAFHNTVQKASCPNCMEDRQAGKR